MGSNMQGPHWGDMTHCDAFADAQPKASRSVQQPASSKHRCRGVCSFDAQQQQAPPGRHEHPHTCTWGRCRSQTCSASEAACRGIGSRMIVLRHCGAQHPPLLGSRTNIPCPQICVSRERVEKAAVHAPRKLQQFTHRSARSLPSGSEPTAAHCCLPPTNTRRWQHSAALPGRPRTCPAVPGSKPRTTQLQQITHRSARNLPSGSEYSCSMVCSTRHPRCCSVRKMSCAAQGASDKQGTNELARGARQGAPLLQRARDALRSGTGWQCSNPMLSYQGSTWVPKPWAAAHAWCPVQGPATPGRQLRGVPQRCLAVGAQLPPAPAAAASLPGQSGSAREWACAQTCRTRCQTTRRWPAECVKKGKGANWCASSR